MKAPEEVAELNVLKSCHMFLSGWQQLKEMCQRKGWAEPLLSAAGLFQMTRAGLLYVCG